MEELITKIEALLLLAVKYKNLIGLKKINVKGKVNDSYPLSLSAQLNPQIANLIEVSVM